jgi:hypothetical protein
MLLIFFLASTRWGNHASIETMKSLGIDPKNDYAFKSVFGSERHSRLLIHLLNAVLGPYRLRVRSVRILNPLSEVQDLDDKKLILDVKAVDEQGRLYVLNNAQGLDLENLPRKLRVAEIEEALEAWAMLTQDRMKREIYEAREKARRDAEDWRLALQRAQERLQESFSQGRKEGREEGRSVGVWLGRIRAYEELLQRTPRPDAELAAMSADELGKLAEELRAALSHG